MALAAAIIVIVMLALLLPDMFDLAREVTNH